MFYIDTVILVAGALLLTGIASSKFSTRFGVPVLVLFLAIGMLAGSEGLGGIEFENYKLAHAIGTLSLALILFDGGLSTTLAGIRSAWRPSLALATVGVVITALITGLIAAKILGISLLQGLLLGSIIGSTDAAAVFAVLRLGGVALPKRLQSTLEIESGINDPMAIFLTLGCIHLSTGDMQLGPDLFWLFTRQMTIGAFVGLAGGYVAAKVVNRINLDIGGLYPILVSAFALLIYGVAAHWEGSGFLAVYLAGIVLGNGRLVFKRGIFLFHDALAWLSQITMFVVLGLLVFPSRLLAVAWQGLAIAVVLCLLARPIAVVLSLLPFRFKPRELALLSWVGLKGAVPITLATFPLLYGVPQASVLFDVVFFVVVVSALVQGWTLPLVAKRLGLMTAAEPSPPVSLEISSLRYVEGDIVDYTVTEDSRAAGKHVRELALPDGCTIAMIARQEQLIPPQGQTRIEPGDHVIIVLRPGVGALVNQVFARVEAREELPVRLEFPLRASISVGELEEFYGFSLDAPPTDTLDAAIRRILGDEPPRVGSIVRFQEIALHVRELNRAGTITQVGMVVLSAADEKR
ncbi:MAG: potassium/proton antiporter [Planctomycetia bacterium]|nr:potassium/proton antiporter [Planctomycetia bacterium]